MRIRLKRAYENPAKGDGCRILVERLWPRGLSKEAAKLDLWAKDDDFWIRRSALLALLLPLRRGEGDWRRFVRYADGMLDEREFFIRKAIGWILRETSKRSPKRVADFLELRLARTSGVTFREAVKYLPEPKAAALKKKKTAGPKAGAASLSDRARRR